MELLAEPRITRHKLTVAQVERMAEFGVLAPDVRIELIDGEVIGMAPTGTRHSSAVLRLLRCFREPRGDRWDDVSVVTAPGLMALPGLAGLSVDLTGLL